MRLAVCDSQPIFTACSPAQISAAGTAINPTPSDNIGHQLPIAVPAAEDRKSTCLNSSHEWNSYAVFCLKKKKNKRGGELLLRNIPCLYRDLLRREVREAGGSRGVSGEQRDGLHRSHLHPHRAADAEAV